MEIQEDKEFLRIELCWKIMDRFYDMDAVQLQSVLDFMNTILEKK